MSKFEEHCARSLTLFGDEFQRVHRWLDELAGSERYGMKHRRVRHHAAGIEEAVRLFGAEVRPAARQHVIDDLKMEGWTEADHFPRDEADYVRMGLF